jgi:hypothetical protein
MLADAVAEVGAELRLVEVADYINFICSEQLANLHDIVSSSTELYFKPGTLTFSWTARFDLDWARPPVVTLGMEFRHLEVWVVFDLILRGEEAGVRIEHLVVSGADRTTAEDTDRLIAALADARITDRDR